MSDIILTGDIILTDRIIDLSIMIAKELQAISSHVTVEITSSSMKVTEDIAGVPLIDEMEN